MMLSDILVAQKLYCISLNLLKYCALKSGAFNLNHPKKGSETSEIKSFVH